MAIRKIIDVKEENAFLRKTSREVEKFDDRLSELIGDMFDTLAVSNGVGLAAPQIGLLKRVAVVVYEDVKLVLINAKILKSSGEEIDTEGCLSVKGVNGKVARPTKLSLLNYDKKGNAHKMNISGYVARIVCHELDHLDGVLFTDRMIKE